MPIDRALYPPDWPAISRRIRGERAAGRCECEGECERDHGGRCDELNHTPARAFKGRVVLTVAHLNHTPMDVREDNLRAYCQACHLRYDRRLHAQTRTRRRTPMTPPEPHPPTVLGTLAALHYAAGGSDKVWAGGVLEEAGSARVVTCWGRRGLRLSEKHDAMPSRAAAEAFLAKKTTEKRAKGYTDVDYREPRYGLLETLQRLLPPLSGVTPTAGNAEDAVAQVRTELGAVVSRVTAAALDALEAAIDDPAVGLTEKVNGERCALKSDGETLTAYNRLGKALPGLPRGASVLLRLGEPFLIDGEWLPDGYAAFDLLELGGDDLRPAPYLRRITRLREVLLDAHLSWGGSATRAGDAAPMTPGLWLLVPARDAVEKRAAVEAIREAGGEGVVLRHLDAPSLPGKTPWERKVKFDDELDALVLGVKPGRVEGSLRLGLVRPRTLAEGQAFLDLIEIGSVRSGLNGADVESIGAWAEALRAVGEYAVLRVSFLRARTVGTALVEPKTGPDCLREDKPWKECTTEQLVDVFGEERRAAINAAKAYAG
jgi:predicted DNA-binding WGR domain protein